MFQYEVIHFEDNLYKVVRTLKDEPKFDVEDLKVCYNCNMVLRKRGILYFCSKIEDAIILSDDNDEQIQLVEERTQESTETQAEPSIEGQVPTATAD